jgi:asparagine synthase (glutamine-hydrolysing)
VCGIAGIISPHEARDVVGKKMLGALLHRGPDGENSASFVSERMSVFLGNTRLAIVDVENGQQPLTNEDGQLVVVFNGEIYNHKELRGELVRRGHSLNSLSDGEVIPHLYEEYGLAAFERLRGMFAIALFDKSDGDIFLVRGDFGKKSFILTKEEKFRSPER